MAVEPLSSLRKHPDLARQVGLVVADFAVLELNMYILYACFSTHVGDAAFHAFYSWRSLHLREEMILKEARERMDDRFYKIYTRLWKRLKTAATRRAEIAHCAFIGPKGVPLRMRLVGEKATYEPLDQAIFDRTFTQYRTLCRDIVTFLIFGVRDRDRFHQIAQTLPMSRLLDRPVAQLETPPDQEKLSEAELKASLSRLGLSDLLQPDPQPPQ